MSKYIGGYIGIGLGALVTAALADIKFGILLFCLMGLGFTMGWIVAHIGKNAP